jgi:hypothetical protein
MHLLYVEVTTVSFGNRGDGEKNLIEAYYKQQQSFNAQYIMCLFAEQIFRLCSVNKHSNTEDKYLLVARWFTVPLQR